MAGWPGEGKGPLPHRTSVSLFVEGNNHSTHPASLSLIHLFIHSFSHLLNKHLLSTDRTRLDAAVCQRHPDPWPVLAGTEWGEMMVPRPGTAPFPSGSSLLTSGQWQCSSQWRLRDTSWGLWAKAAGR